MSEWKSVTFKDIAEFNPRESIKKGEIATKVAMDKLQPFCRDVPETEKEAFFGGTKFRNGDTIMARITPCLENGKTAMVNVLVDGEIGFGSTEYIVYRAKEGITDPYFLYYLVCSPMVREPAIKSMVGSSGRQRVQTDVVQNLEFMIPDFEEQKIIGEFLKKIDDKIAVNNKINRNLLEQAGSLYKEWFINFGPWNREMPSNWTEGALGDFVEIKRGGSPRPIQDYLVEEGLNWLKISDVTSVQSPYIMDINDHIKEEGLKKTVYLKAGSLVLSNSATPGIPKILDVDSCIHDGWLYFPSSQLSNYYLYLLFRVIRQQLVNLSNGSVFNNLKTDILKKYSAVLPDSQTLEEFDSLVGPLFEAMLENTRETHRLSELRDNLLPKLMSGELDVSDLDI